MSITSEQKKIIEAALYVSGDNGLTLNDLYTLLEIDKHTIKQLMNELIDYYKANDDLAFNIMIFDDKYKLLTKPELNSSLMKLAKIKYKNPLSKSLMEILTIIAYNAPITKKEIEKLKPGFKKIKFDSIDLSELNLESNCEYAIKRLKELELIEGIPLEDVPGRPFAYKTTKKFLDVFGLKNIKDLPKLKNKEEEN